MDINDLIKGIVPLTLLAIWALNSLFNREAPPQPNRTVRGPGPRPGPGVPRAPRPPERAGGTMSREPTLRWGNPSAPGQERARQDPARPSASSDEEILIIRPEPSRPAASTARRPQQGPGGGTGRRQTKPRSPSPAAPRPPESPPPPSQGSMPDLNVQINRPLELSPLGGSPLAQGASVVPSAAASTTGVSPGPSSDWASLIGTREAVRRAIVINEILQPPLAFRRRRSP